jgi:hypothetical protein
VGTGVGTGVSIVEVPGHGPDAEGSILARRRATAAKGGRQGGRAGGPAPAGGVLTVCDDHRHFLQGPSVSG